MDQAPLEEGLLGDLRLLDPFAFWIIPGEPYEVDFAVLGVTGGYVVLGDQHPGYVKVSMGRATADGERIHGFSKAKRGARLFTEALLRQGVHVPQVEPFMCFRSATVGRPRQFKSVWIANPADLRKMVAERPVVLQHKDAKAYAERLGALKNAETGAKPLVEEPETEGTVSDADDAALGGLTTLGGFGDF